MIEKYQPKHLSNYEYKILAFILVNRIQKMLHSIMLIDQTAYVKGLLYKIKVTIIESCHRLLSS